MNVINMKLLTLLYNDVVLPNCCLFASDECLSNRNFLQIVFSPTTILVDIPHALSPLQALAHS